jgi:hypothetical protein
MVTIDKNNKAGYWYMIRFNSRGGRYGGNSQTLAAWRLMEANNYELTWTSDRGSVSTNYGASEGRIMEAVTYYTLRHG